MNNESESGFTFTYIILTFLGKYHIQVFASRTDASEFKRINFSKLLVIDKNKQRKPKTE